MSVCRICTRRCLRAVALLCAVRAPACPSQNIDAVAPPQTLEGALHEMSDAAGVIFAGQVMSVRRLQSAAPNPSSGVVEVVFRVDQAVRGCVAGGSYVLREWAGLWANGEPRYLVGQRLLMMLRAPGAGGMSSPVGGLDGAIPIRGAVSEIAAAVMSESKSSAAAPARMVDLRWVGARMLRSLAVSSGNVVSGTKVASGTSVSAGGADSNIGGSVAAQGASVNTVVGMLGAWEQSRAAR